MDIKKITCIFAVFIILAVIAINTPKTEDEKFDKNEQPKFLTEDRYGPLGYLGRTYTLCTEYPSLFDYELDKEIGKDGSLFPISFHTLKNDPNKNFIYVSEWQSSRIYSCLDIKDDDFSDLNNVKAIELTINDEVIMMTDEECINDFRFISENHSTKKIQYKENECIIIKSRPIIKGYPIEYHYKSNAFIYDGEQWLVINEWGVANDANHSTIYCGHPIESSEIRIAFEHIAEKYFADIYHETIDYEVGTVDPDEEFIIDPAMATLAD